jgi:mannosylfructose-phosphate synthase
MQADYPGQEATFETEFNFTDRIANERVLYEACDCLVATTPAQVDLLAQDYGIERKRIEMIPPGYDENRFFPVSRSTRDVIRHRLGFEGKVVLALGRLATNKGYDLLVDAFAVLAEREPDARLHLAVGGNDMDKAEREIFYDIKERVAALEIGDKVTLDGYVRNEDLADCYRAADLFVLSSRYEPFGMTAVEAMACGTPSVITTHGGLFEAVNYGRHALFADPFDKYDLAITMMKPFRHEKLQGRLSRMGAHKARSLFTWTGIAQQLVAVAEGGECVLVFEDNDWAEPWHEGD